MVYIENHLSNINTKFYGELSQLLLKRPDYPGSNNGTGLLQLIVGLKMRETFERLTQQASEQLVTA